MCFFDNNMRLLKSSNVLGVGWRRVMSIVFLIWWIKFFMYFIIWKVVELFSLVDILFIKRVFLGLIIIFFVYE